jgi:hypothetical protein
MNYWMWPVSLVGILSTAVVCGTDMFFLTVGRPALRLASSSAGTEDSKRYLATPSQFYDHIHQTRPFGQRRGEH